MKKTYTHWFWWSTHSDGYRIHTQGLGNHPAGKHWYETLDELQHAIKSFVADDYQNMGEL